MPLSGYVRTGAHDFTRRLFIRLTFGTRVTDQIARHRQCISRPSETHKKNKNTRDGDDIGFGILQGSGNLLSLEQTGLQLYRFLRYNRNQCCHSWVKDHKGKKLRVFQTSEPMIPAIDAFARTVLTRCQRRTTTRTFTRLWIRRMTRRIR